MYPSSGTLSRSRVDESSGDRKSALSPSLSLALSNAVRLCHQPISLPKAPLDLPAAVASSSNVPFFIITSLIEQSLEIFSIAYLGERVSRLLVSSDGK